MAESNGHAPWYGTMMSEKSRGNTYAVGNRGQHHRASLRKELINADTPQKIREIRDKLIELALGGDVQAARLYLDHVIGKPLRSIEITGAGGSPLDIVKVVTVIMGAIGDNPDTRAKVGAALAQLEDSHGQSRHSDQPEPTG